ncbi:hypothetical protein IBX35_04730 [Candidatus Bathyarchaeota archaeon]|nr:hypothetical protein [Candidatus Bathyarchaeota archaeon]
MKVKNKQGESKNFSRNKRLIYVAIAIMAILILTGFFLYYHPNQPSQPKAAIIDQLNSSQLTETSRFRNQTFVKTAKELLYKRFPEVDYYSDNATVDQYRSLPSLGYRLIIWRVHSALDLDGEFVAICSSEKHIPGKYEQYSADQLTLCNITGDRNLYFAITPKFVEECMSGRFEDTVIVFMSCNGLKQGYTKTAETFVEKGAKAWISWNGWIDASDNDHAITLLLDYLINKNNTISEAVHKTPSYPSFYGSSKLDYYPRPEVKDYRIPDYKEANIARNAPPAVIAVFLRAKSKLKRAS